MKAKAWVVLPVIAVMLGAAGHAEAVYDYSTWANVGAPPERNATEGLGSVFATGGPVEYFPDHRYGVIRGLTISDENAVYTGFRMTVDTAFAEAALAVWNNNGSPFVITAVGDQVYANVFGGVSEDHTKIYFLAPLAHNRSLMAYYEPAPSMSAFTFNPTERTFIASNVPELPTGILIPLGTLLFGGLARSRRTHP